ncbi:copper transporter [Corynebacterium sp.]|uniref:copper transporter n=1 Tax=Corynebacterium sp. TaxID=1720 RepID=UPI0026DCD869|nr:copper transporter [Corynebacterium sp.]MDO5031641.1 copper transporter [Corynebacterium sp.]
MAKGNSLLGAGLGFGAAIGIALGALVIAPNMSGGGSTSANEELRQEYRSLVQDQQITEAQVGSADSVVRDLAPYVVDGSLAQRPVLVIATGEADDFEVGQVQKLLKSADSVNAGTITLSDEFFRQESADKLLSLVTSALPAGATLDPKKVDAGTHSGQALASALMLDPESTEELASTKDRAALLQTLRDAKFIDYEDGTILPAQAVVVVGGKGLDGYFSDSMLKFLEGFDSVGKSTVFAGRVETAAEDRVIGKLREEDSSISTVDSINRATSQMAAVMAVKEQLDGGSGAYGSAASAKAAAPALPKDL